MASTTSQDVSNKLEEFRDAPVMQPSGQDLYTIFQFLVLENSPAESQLHWFCAQAQPLVFEAATFLLRLHAYSSSLVAQWREKLQTCMAGCAQCVKGLQEVKGTSRHT